MVTDPAEIPFTKPVALIVATAGLEETHGFAVAGVPLPVNCVVKPAQAVNTPLIVGEGLTTIVKFCGLPLQLFNTGVTVIVAVIEDPVAFNAVNAPMLPEPLAPKPIEGVLFTQLKVVLAVLFPVKVIAVVDAFAQTVCEATAFTVGIGFTVIVKF
ncbi:hypothetical protein D3C86_1172510 [compost metagenome]